MSFRSALLKFSLPLLASLFIASCNQGTAVKPYYPERGYQHVEEKTWFAHNKTGIPYTSELEYKRVVWRDALAYNQGEFLALTASNNGLETPKVVYLNTKQNPRVVFGEEFPRRFRRISLDAQDYGVDGPEEEIALVMQYDDKESVVIINPATMSPVFWYESDDISLIDTDKGKKIVGVDYETGRPSVEAYRWDGEKYARTEVPQEISLTDEMVEEIEQNKNDLLATVLSNPQEAITKTQQILGTDNPLLVSTALQFATRDAYAVDGKESKSLWQYLVEYDVKPEGARARVALDPLAAYIVLNKMEIGQTPLPWSDNEALAIVVAKQLSRESGNTYLNLRLTRDERGNPRLEGDIEPGERLVKVMGTAQVYVPVAVEEAKRIQESLSSRTQQNIESFREILKRAEERGVQRQQESQRRTEQLKERARQQAGELKRSIGEEAEKVQEKGEEIKEGIKSTICGNLPSFIPKPEACE